MQLIQHSPTEHLPQFYLFPGSTATNHDTAIFGTMTDQSDRATGNDRLESTLQIPPNISPENESDNGPETPVVSGSNTSVTVERTEPDPVTTIATSANAGRGSNHGPDDEDDEEEDEEGDDEDDDEEDEEPRLKYARLTQSLSGLYRNGDATSAFLVGGDKMVRSSFALILDPLMCLY